MGLIFNFKKKILLIRNRNISWRVGSGTAATSFTSIIHFGEVLEVGVGAGPGFLGLLRGPRVVSPPIQIDLSVVLGLDFGAAPGERLPVECRELSLKINVWICHRKVLAQIRHGHTTNVVSGIAVLDVTRAVVDLSLDTALLKVVLNQVGEGHAVRHHSVGVAVPVVDGDSVVVVVGGGSLILRWALKVPVVVVAHQDVEAVPLELDIVEVDVELVSHSIAGFAGWLATHIIRHIAPVILPAGAGVEADSNSALLNTLDVQLHLLVAVGLHDDVL